jgi:hypothetical protein
VRGIWALCFLIYRNSVGKYSAIVAYSIGGIFQWCKVFHIPNHPSSASHTCLAGLSFSHAFALFVSYGRAMLQTIPDCQIELFKGTQEREFFWL